MIKYDAVFIPALVALVIGGLLFPLQPEPPNPSIEYYDVLYLYGGSVLDSVKDQHIDKLSEVIKGMPYFTSKAFDLSEVHPYSLVNIRASMIILFAHGMLNYTNIDGFIFNNYRFNNFLLGFNPQFLVVQSCFAGRFQELPSSINILASSNDTEAIFQVRTNGSITWEFLDTFLDFFSFNLTQSYNRMIPVLDVEGYNFDDEANATIYLRQDGLLSYHDFKEPNG